MKTPRFLNARHAVGLCLCLAIAQPAWCDQWVSNVTPTKVDVEDVGNAPLLYFAVAQPLVNPANCVSTDGYSMTDPVIVNSSYAAVLAAMSSQQTISLLVSSTQCAVNGRPLVKIIQIP